MPSPTGGANLLWTDIRGAQAALDTIRRRMEALGATVSSEIRDDGQPAIRAAYQDDLDVRGIGSLLNAIDAGKFGAVTTNDLMMPLDTLPADKCIRHSYPGG